MQIRLLSLLVLFYLHFPTLLAVLNVSHLLTYSVAQHPDDSHPSPFLKEVLKVIAEKQKWDLRSIRVSRLEKVRFGCSERHSFPVRVGNKRDLVVRYWEQVQIWQNVENGSNSFEQLVKQVSSEAVLRPFLMDGPFLLSVDGSDDRLSLRLPKNTSFSGLKQIIVAEGITLEIKGAKEVSISLSSCNGMLSGGSHMKSNDRPDFWPLWQSFCQPLLPIRVAGSVLVTAFRRNNSSSTVEKNFVAKGIVELKTEKCYERNMLRKPHCPMYLRSRVVAVQHLLRTILGEKINQHLNHSMSFRKASTKATTFVQFQLELARDVGVNDSQQGKLPEWRTKPSVERVWFDVVARIDLEKLKHVSVKQVKPFIFVDSTSWSYLFSNISLTEISNILVAPHPLTLDVKW